MTSGLLLVACAGGGVPGLPSRIAPAGTIPATTPTLQAPALRISGTVTAVSLSARVIVVTSSDGAINTIAVQPAALIRNEQGKVIGLEQIMPDAPIEAIGGKDQGSTMLAESITILPAPAGQKTSPQPTPAATPGSVPTAQAQATPSPEDLQRLLPADAKLLYHTAADLDGDGKNEVAALVAFGISPDGLSAQKLELYIMSPAAAGYAVVWRSGPLMGERAGPLQALDVNRDGRAEVLSTQSMGASGETMYVFAWQGNHYGALQPHGGHFDGWGSFGESAAGLADLDRDGVPEITASYGPAGSQTDVYRWDGQAYRYLQAPPQPAGDATPQPLRLRLYFIRDEGGEPKFVPVVRVMPRTPAMARTSIVELLKGPTEEEKRSGLQTAIPAGVQLKVLRIQDGVAYAEFDKALEEGVGGSVRVMSIRRQITLTLQQFSTVQNVTIAVDGRVEDVLQP